MANQCKKTGVAAVLVDQLYRLTQTSPLVVVGKVVRWQRLFEGRDGGAGPLYRLVVQGYGGQVVPIFTTDQTHSSLLGGVVVLPVVLAEDGYLRQAAEPGQANGGV